VTTPTRPRPFRNWPWVVAAVLGNAIGWPLVLYFHLPWWLW
jgi:hypothetical protein